MAKYRHMFISIMAFLILYMPNFAEAAKAKRKTQPDNPKYSALIIDETTGAVLYEKNATHPRYPASLAKMMTAYLVFEALESRYLSKNQLLHVSESAASRPRSNMGLKKGELITVQDAMLCTVIKSANDTAVVLAEAVAGSEEHFARMMTQKARELGMYSTTFRNASGLHHSQQVTTAHDLAKLAIALKKDFPEYYHLFSRNTFIFRGIKYRGHNNVVDRYPGADGIKTGFVNASGFNLVTSAKRNNHRLIGVVLGGETAKLRDSHMIALLDKHFTPSMSPKMQDLGLAFFDEESKESFVTKATSSKLSKVSAKKKHKTTQRKLQKASKRSY